MSESPLVFCPAPKLPSSAVRKRPQPQPIRLVLADPQLIFRECLRSYLNSKRGFTVVGETSSGQDALAIVRKLRPDILLLDISMPPADGMSIIREVRDLAMGVRVLVLTAKIVKSDVVRALQLGASGVLLKTDGVDTLLDGMRRVMAGEYSIGKTSVASLIQATSGSAQPKLAPLRFGLTPRENEVVAAVLAGYSNPEISEKLEVSEQTVKHHLTNIFDKLGIYSRMQLALFAVNHRLYSETE